VTAELAEADVVEDHQEYVGSTCRWRGQRWPPRCGFPPVVADDALERRGLHQDLLVRITSVGRCNVTLRPFRRGGAGLDVAPDSLVDRTATRSRRVPNRPARPN